MDQTCRIHIAEDSAALRHVRSLWSEVTFQETLSENAKSKGAFAVYTTFCVRNRKRANCPGIGLCFYGGNTGKMSQKSRGTGRE